MAVTPEHFREVALALPEATEGAHMGHADFRVAAKVFASLGVPTEGHGMVKLTPLEQDILRERSPKVFTPAAGAWGRSGYTLVRLDSADARTLISAMRAAWRNTAPRRLVAAFDRDGK